MIKKLLKSSLLAFVAFLLVSGVALADWEYLFSVSVVDTSNTTRVYVPIMLGFGGQPLVDAEKITASGTDTNMQVGSTSIKYMMSTTNVTAVIPSLPSGGVVVAGLYTGYSPVQTSFPVIPGSSGNVTVVDDASIELSDNFSVLFDGWIDTTAGANKNMVGKPNTFNLFISDTVSGNITADIIAEAAFNFTGTPDKLERVDSAALSAISPLTVECWIRTTDATAAWQGLVNKKSVAAGQREWALALDNGNTRLSFSVYDASVPASIGRRDTNAVVNDGAWHYIYASWDGGAADANIELWIDDVQVDDANAGVGAFVNIEDRNSPLQIGTETFDSEYFIGDIDEVRISDKVRSAAERTAFYNAGAGACTRSDGYTIVLYHCDDDGGGTTPDFSSNSLDATITGATLTDGQVDCGASLTATGVATGNHSCDVSAAPLLWATGNRLLFDGTVANSNINCGNGLYSGNQTFWINFWVMWPAGFGVGSPQDETLWTIRQGAVDRTWIYAESSDGLIYFIHQVAGVNALAFSSIGYTSWAPNTWYNILVTMVDDGAKIDGAMYIDSTFTQDGSDAARRGLPNGTFLIGNKDDPGAGGTGTIGYIANLRCGADNLTASERILLYEGVVLGDETDFWYIDEGSGVVVTSYGSLANHGTADVNTSWTYGDRPCKFTIAIDGTFEDSFARPVTVPDTSANWTMYQYDSLIYSDNLSIVVDGVVKLWFRPTTMLTGATVPDRSGNGNVGTIHWGSNSGMNIVYGGLTSYESYTAEIGIAGGFDVPTASMPETWFAAGAGAANLPFYDSFSEVAAQTGKPVQVLYAQAIIGVAFGVFLGLVMFTRSALIAYIAMVMVFGIGSSMTIIPAWIVFTMIIVGVGIMYLYKQVVR